MAFQTILSDATGTRDVAADASQKGIAALGMRRDADTTVSEADGDLVLATYDSTGRLKVVSQAQSFTATTTSFTTSTQNMAVDVSKASNITWHVKGGTVNGVGGNWTFEASIDSTNGTDGTWFGIQGARTNANIVEGTTGAQALNIGIGLAWAYEFSVNAYTWFRSRTTALTSGNYSVTVIRGAFATEPAPAMQTHAVSQSGAWSVSSLSPGTAAANLGKGEDAAHTSGDTGVAVWAVRNDNAATAPTSATGDYSQFSVDANGALFTRDKPSTTPALTNVTSVNTTTTLLALNAARRAAVIYNDSTADLYIKLGATASTTSFTVKLASGGYYEVPGWYTGIIDGIWSAANGAARVTEVS